jgi:predicted acylesterase/phospholipase RssA
MPPGPEPRKKRSLILAGGGLKVAFQAGVLQVWLDEAGLTFDHVDGASGGVFNLAMYCQGMNGRTMADNWRKTNPLQGISPNIVSPAQLDVARSLFTLDAYRSHVFPGWGLDWNKIASSKVDATFNVYNFSQHELEVLPPAKMTEDMLCACVSLPMWFPPVEINGNTYIDPVYVTDANLEEALRRGSDEIWVIWTVSRLGKWNDGFVANYFQIIESSANGNFNRLRHRIEDNNAKQAAGGGGEFGRHVELKILAAEVSLHYLINLSSDRLIEAVNSGVQQARTWCTAQGIPFTPGPDSAVSAPAAVTTSLEFTEQMKGFVTKGESDYQRGFDTGKKAGTDAMVRLTIHVDNVDAFVTTPQHEAKIVGIFNSETFGGSRPVQDGVFNLFVDLKDPSRKAMYYRLWFTDAQGQELTLLGFKDIKDDPGNDVWEDTTTLYTRILKGHVTADDDTAALRVASGIIKIQLLDFLQQLTTFRIAGGTLADQTGALARFGRLFMGKLWDVYGQQVLPFSPI